jgi:WD40 repeat protein
MAWFSADGKATAWSIHNWPGERSSACSSPVIVEVLDRPGSWQLPGSIINIRAMAVSSDGTRSAFDGTYQPAGPRAVRGRLHRTTGLHYADSQTNAMRLILPLLDDANRVTSISFSPNGEKFVYDYKNRIYVYNVGEANSHEVGAGAGPTWSPDGKWIAFRSEDGEAVTLDSATYRSKAVIGRRQIRTSVHWSPGSRYIMVAEPLGPISNLLHGRNPIFGPTAQMVVERIDDHATVVVYFFQPEGFWDNGFYWIPDRRAFIQTASNAPAIKACDHAD